MAVEIRIPAHHTQVYTIKLTVDIIGSAWRCGGSVKPTMNQVLHIVGHRFSDGLAVFIVPAKHRDVAGDALRQHIDVFAI